MPNFGDVRQKVDAMLAELQLTKGDEARAAIARTLAAKMDEAALDDTTGASQAMPALSKELRATLDAIIESQSEGEELVAGIFREE